MEMLIKIDDKGLVSARDLYEFLGATERFNSWFERYCKYGFEEGTDYTSVKSFTVVNNGAKKEIDDYAMTVEMAKEFSMLQKTEKGSQARKYFIACEKKLKEISEEEKFKLQLFSDDPMEVVSAHKQLVEIAKRPLIKENTELKTDNTHKKEVIQGLTDNIPTQDKRAILNKVVRKGGKYQERWNLLYKTYKETYHIDIKLRCENYKKKTGNKSMSVLEFADKNLGAIDELYGIAAKLFESDVKKLVQELYDVVQ